MAIEQFSHSLPMVLYRTLDAVMPRFRKIFNEFGLTEQQWRVLRVLWDQQAVTLNRLAALTAIFHIFNHLHQTGKHRPQHLAFSL